MDSFSFVEGPIDVDDYLRVREAAGWPALEYNTALDALGNSLYSVNAVSATEVVGFGRVVGDGVLYFFIQDVIVLPRFTGLGLESKIMERIMGYLRSSARPGAFVGKMANGILSGFYVSGKFPEQGGNEPAGRFGVWPGSGTD